MKNNAERLHALSALIKERIDRSRMRVTIAADNRDKFFRDSLRTKDVENARKVLIEEIKAEDKLKNLCEEFRNETKQLRFQELALVKKDPSSPKLQFVREQIDIYENGLEQCDAILRQSQISELRLKLLCIEKTNWTASKLQEERTLARRKLEEWEQLEKEDTRARNRAHYWRRYLSILLEEES